MMSQEGPVGPPGTSEERRGEERRVGGEEFIGGIGRYWHPQREYSDSRHQGFTFIESSPGNWWQLATNDKHHEKLKLLSTLKLTFTSLTC